MKNIVCPKCFSKHGVEELAWGCSNSDCSREGVPTSAASLAEGKPLCSACHKELTLRFCPNCGFQIVVGEGATDTLPISIVGSEGAGKSNYLAVLINEIRHSVGRAYNSSLFPIGGDDTIDQYNNLYYRPLYEESHCIPSTDQDSVRPLVYSMVFDGERDGTTTNLTFYDACGANFRSERVMADYNRSIYNSRGIIFFVDPSQLPTIRDEYIAKGKPVLADDFSSLLARTIRLLRDGNNQSSFKEKINIPIAICISKLDTLKNYLDPSSFLNYPSRHLAQPAFDTIDHQCCSAEVEALVQSWSGTDLINQVKAQFSNYRFFSFSALGSAPTEDNGITHVAPFRVCDPFLWLLAHNNVIKAGPQSPVK